MANIIAATSPQPARVRVALDVTPSTTPGNYTLTRQDGAYTPAVATNAWLIDSNTIELSVSPALLAGVVYVMTVVGAAAPVNLSYMQAGAPQALPTPGDDPEAEVFGVDIAWLDAGSLTPTGDMPQRRGVPCLVHDQAAMQLTAPGEIVHRPTEGANISAYTNGPGTRARLQQMVAAAKKQSQRDPRVRAGGVTASAGVNATTGETDLVLSIKPVAIDDNVTIPVRG